MKFWELLRMIPDDVDIEVTCGTKCLTFKSRTYTGTHLINPYNNCYVIRIAPGVISEQEAYFTGRAIGYISVLLEE